MAEYQIGDDAKRDPRFNATTTKREMFAAMTLQGLLSNPGAGGYPAQADIEWTIPLAVKYADALIAALKLKE